VRLTPHTNIWVCPFCKGQDGAPRVLERTYANDVDEYEAADGIARLIGLHMIRDHAEYTRTPLPSGEELPYVEGDE